MKKFLSMLLALTLVLFAFTAFAETVNPDDIEDTMTAEDGKYELAFVTDVGQLKDKSFNQGTWNGVKAYAAANGLSYKYYQPANGDQATDDDRYDAMKAACEGGAKVVVCAGFLQEAALRKAAETYPDTKFVFVDGYPLDLENVAPIAFKEEQSGYLAGYAIVKDGFTKLGFMGGGGGTITINGGTVNATGTSGGIGAGPNCGSRDFTNKVTPKGTLKGTSIGLITGTLVPSLNTSSFTGLIKNGGTYTVYGNLSLDTLETPLAPDAAAA